MKCSEASGTDDSSDWTATQRSATFRFRSSRSVDPSRIRWRISSEILRSKASMPAVAWSSACRCFPHNFARSLKYHLVSLNREISAPMSWTRCIFRAVPFMLFVGWMNTLVVFHLQVRSGPVHIFTQLSPCGLRCSVRCESTPRLIISEASRRCCTAECCSADFMSF